MAEIDSGVFGAESDGVTFWSSIESEAEGRDEISSAELEDISRVSVVILDAVSFAVIA